MGLRDKLRHMDRQREAEKKLEAVILDMEEITRDAFRMALAQTLRAEAMEHDRAYPETHAENRDEGGPRA